MNAKLTVGSADIELGFKDLEWIAEMLQDSPENAEIMAELAKSESYLVRVVVASKSHINPETFESLVNDSSIDVLRTLSSNPNIIRIMSKERIDKLIKTEDPEILINLAEKLSSLSYIVDIDCLYEILIQQDISVRYILAKNQSTPIFLLTELIHDRDFNVANRAVETLNNLEL